MGDSENGLALFGLATLYFAPVGNSAAIRVRIDASWTLERRGC